MYSSRTDNAALPGQIIHQSPVILTPTVKAIPFLSALSIDDACAPVLPGLGPTDKVTNLEDQWSARLQNMARSVLCGRRTARAALRR